MTSHVGSAALVVALVAGAGLAMAQTSGTTAPSAGLELTPQQRTAIYQIVSREKGKVRTPPPVTLRVSVGAELPASLELYTLPDDVGAEVPATKLYKYTVVQDQVVIVDPTTMKVIDVIHQ